MNGQCLGALFAIMTVMLLVPMGVEGQTLTSAVGDWTLSRTPWGDPDLQGTWTNTTTTPLQRPDDLAGTQVLTGEELAERDREVAERVNLDNRRGGTGAYNEFWAERGRLNAQTSLIVDPVDGRLPSLTPREEQRTAERVEARQRHPADGPEDLNLYSRCISRGLPGAMMPGFYNHNYQILQTPGYVVVFVEMIHDARIIPLDGRPHVGPAIRQWLGDSRGRWEGDTLVIETTNFTNKVYGRSSLVFGASENMHLVERFTRVADDTIDYQFTLHDPTEYVEPWTVATPMTVLDGPLFEYACHEGNYAMPNVLSGQRSAEKVTDADATRESR